MEGSSWRHNVSPVGPADLKHVHVLHWSSGKRFDGESWIVASDSAEIMVSVFKELYYTDFSFKHACALTILRPMMIWHECQQQLRIQLLKDEKAAPRYGLNTLTATPLTSIRCGILGFERQLGPHQPQWILWTAQ